MSQWGVLNPVSCLVICVWQKWPQFPGTQGGVAAIEAYGAKCMPESFSGLSNDVFTDLLRNLLIYQDDKLSAINSTIMMLLNIFFGEHAYYYDWQWGSQYNDLPRCGNCSEQGIFSGK